MQTLEIAKIFESALRGDVFIKDRTKLPVMSYFLILFNEDSISLEDVTGVDLI